MLDLTLPDIDGIDLARGLTKVTMVSPLRGFGAGADDIACTTTCYVAAQFLGAKRAGPRWHYVRRRCARRSKPRKQR